MAEIAPRSTLLGVQADNALCRCWRRGALAILGLTLVCQATTSQQPLEPQRLRAAGLVALQQAVKDASSDTLILLVASHPDDRYVLPATYLRFKMGCQVAVLLFTRGRGGQNSAGPETGDALGRIRTLEAERGARHFGAKIYYLNRPDNGFSRSAEETLEQWREESTVRDFARMIRSIKPDVLLTTHHPEERHGHDLALLQVLPKAIRLAADTEYETKGMAPYEVPRVFRTAIGSEADDPNILSLGMDGWDHSRGGTYRQLAYRALSEHRSPAPLQAMEQLFQPILDLKPLRVWDRPAEPSLTGGLPDLFRAMVGTVPVVSVRSMRDVEFPALEKHLTSRPALAGHAIKLLEKLRAIKPAAGSELERRLARRQEALQRIVLQSAGVQVFIPKPEGEAAPGDDMPLDIWVRNEGDHPITDIEVAAVGGGTLQLVGPGKDKKTLDPHTSLALNVLYCPPDLSERDLRTLFSRDTYEDPLRVRLQMTVGGQPLSIEQTVETELQPAIKVTVTPHTLLLPRDSEELRFIVGVERKNLQEVGLKVRVNPPAGMTVGKNVRPVSMAAKERFREFTFTLSAPGVRPGVSVMHVTVGGYRSRVRVHKVDVAVPRDLKVGLLPGVDTTTYEVLQALLGQSGIEKFEAGQPIPILDNQRFHTIVVDIRALRDENFRRGFARLLDFVEQGGRMVVFYHKDKEFNLDDASFRGAPYPLQIGRGRVTREDAAVRLLNPEHPLFNYPNVIRREDWDGWAQERGLYFPETYDQKYEELLEMRDEGEEQERGAMLYAKYGKGDYIYCALSLYRQLKNRHAGACRLFANLISPQARAGR
ncbi:MAG: PIG-L family deacetylase [Planctomycetota bacterium]|nr:PIG-L family deacetylase [Planctomycetota bacterium]